MQLTDVPRWTPSSSPGTFVAHFVANLCRSAGSGVQCARCRFGEFFLGSSPASDSLAGSQSSPGNTTLPAKAHALLTILEPNGDPPGPATAPAGAGLRRFLSTPDFVLTSEQFRASMEADFFEQ